MRDSTDIRIELDQLAERRAMLWRGLSAGDPAATQAELARVNDRIAGLWREWRQARARERFGAAELIVKRAERHRRLEEQLERDLKRASADRAA